MTNAVLTWPDSDQVVTISRAASRSFDAFDEIAEFLASRYPNHWPMFDLPSGQKQSVDQRMAWRAELGRAHDRAGVVLIARHTSHNNMIIAAAIAMPTEFSHEATLVIQSSGGYAAEDVDPRMLAELRT